MARKVGKQGALYLGVGPTKVADLFDVTFEANTEMEDVSIKMDAFRKYSPSHGHARIRARRYVNTTAVMLRECYDAAKNGELLAFRVDVIDATNTLSQISGEGWIAASSLALPRGAVVEDFEMTVESEWAVTQPGVD